MNDLVNHLIADLVINSTSTGDIVSEEWKPPFMRPLYHILGRSYYVALKDIYFSECDLYVKAGTGFDINWWSTGSNRICISKEDL